MRHLPPPLSLNGGLNDDLTNLDGVLTSPKSEMAGKCGQLVGDTARRGETACARGVRRDSRGLNGVLLSWDVLLTPLLVTVVLPVVRLVFTVV